MYPSKALSKRVTILFIGLFLALSWTSPAFSAPGKRADAEALTKSLVGLNNAYQKAAPNAKSQALQQLIDATVERQALLAEMIESDPGAVLRTAIPTRIRNRMPAEVLQFIEQRIDLEGELEVMYEDYDDGSHRLRHTLNTNNGERISLHFKSNPHGSLSGTEVRASGVLVGDAMAVESGEDDILTLALGGGADGGTNGAAPAPVANTFGEQRIAVILVNFTSNTSEPWTTADAHDVVFNTVNAFFQENSQGQAWLSGDVFGWFTLPLDPAGCPTTDISIEARKAAYESGVNLSDYDRLIYAFPDIGCSWSGLGDVGGSPSTAWFDGTLTEAGVVSHELGHNFGLFHSHSLACSGELPLSDVCITDEYGDVLDRMGESWSGHFNAFQKERLGWLNYGESPAIVTADSSGSYTLEAYASPSNGVKAIRIPRDTDPATGQARWYYLESRQAIGFDDFLVASYYGASVMNGVVFRLGTWDSANSSHLLHMTPDSPTFDWRDLALAVGASYSDPVAGVTVTVDAVDSGGAIVTVSYGPQICVHAAPTVNLIPSGSDWVVPGTPLSYTATVSNNDSGACADGMFDLTSQIPASWTVVFTDPTVSLAPGTSASTSLTVTSSTVAPDGVYDIVVTAAQEADPGYAGSDTATYTVMAETGSSNSPPVAVDDDEILTQVQSVVIDVLANDWDPDNDVIRVKAVSQGAKGTVVNNGNGTLTYTPGRRFKNRDSFSYDVSDETETATATVSISLQTSSKGGGKGGGKPKG